MIKYLNYLKPTIIVVIVASTMLGLIWFNLEFLVDTFDKPRCDGFGCLGYGMVLMFYYACAVAIVLLFGIIYLLKTIKERRFLSIIIMLSLTMLSVFIFIQISSAINEKRNLKITEEMYIDNPQRRPVLDSKRPLSIIEPLVFIENASSPIDIVVYALPGVLEDGQSMVKIMDDVFFENIWGQEILQSTGEEVEGRIVYRAKVIFAPAENWESGIIVVEGDSGNADFANIYP